MGVNSGRLEWDRTTFVAVLAEVAGDYGASMDGSGAFGPLAALLGVGFVEENGAGLVPRHPSAWWASLGPELDAELMARVAPREDCWPAVLAAAEVRPREVLETLLSLPPAVQVLTMPALAMTLTSPGRFGPEAYRRAFAMSVTWWASGVYRDGVQPPIPAPSNTRVGDTKPLVLLAVASVRHADLLLAGLKPADLSPELVAFLDVMEHAPPTPDILGDAFAIAAPRLSERFNSPAFWSWLGEGWGPRSPVIPDNYEFGRWWRLVAGPLLAKTAEGRRLMLGLADGCSIRPALRVDHDRGNPIWQRVLREYRQADEVAVAAVLAEAICIALEIGGTRMQGAVLEVARESRRAEARELRGLSAPIAEGLRPRSYWSERPLSQWLFTELFDDAVVGECWDRWLQECPDDIPGRLMLEAGVSPSDVVTWALAQGAEGLQRRRQDRFLLDREEGDPIHFEPTERRLVLDLVLESEDVDAVWQVARLSEPFSVSHAARLRLAELTSPGAVKRRIELATETTWFHRFDLLRGLTPLPEHEEVWVALLEHSHLGFRVEGLARWAVSSSADGRWDAVVDTIEVLERALSDEQWTRSQLSEELPDDADIDEAYEELVGVLRAATRDGGMARQLSQVLVDARPEDSDGAKAALRALLAVGDFWPSFGDPDLRTWRLALDFFGRDGVEAILLSSVPFQGEEYKLRAAMFALVVHGAVDLVRKMVPHAELGAPAATAIRQIRRIGSGELLEMAADLDPGHPAVHPLLEGAIQKGGAGLVEWLSVRAPTVDAETLEGWCRTSLRAIRGGPLTVGVLPLLVQAQRARP